MLFKDIIGHEKIKERLITSVLDNHISHGQMFLGNEGSGGLALAIAYAQYISCTDKKETDACGVCPSCQKYNKLIHPDLHFVFPVTGPKEPISDDFIKEWREMLLANPYFSVNQWYEKIGVENKQGAIGKSESESIIRKLSLKTFEAEYKIMIIWVPELMNTTASNKLLKILEEPPNKTLFLLIALNSERILPTIISRVQLLKIPGVNAQDMAEALQSKFGISGQKKDAIVRIAEGNWVKALSNLNTEEETNTNFEYFKTLMRVTFVKNIAEILDWSENMAGIGREKQKTFLQYALRMVRENLMLTIQQNNLALLNDEEFAFCQKFHRFIDINAAIGMMQEYNKTFTHIEMNGNAKIVLLDMALKISQLFKK